MARIRALSCKQPWAELIARGVKTLEIRGRNTHYRGELAVHASSRYDGSPAAVAAYRAHIGDQMSRAQRIRDLPAGRLVAVVTLTASDPWEPGHLGEACTPWRPAAWAWTLNGGRRVDSVLPVKGQLGIWECPDGLLKEREPCLHPDLDVKGNRAFCYACTTWIPYPTPVPPGHVRVRLGGPYHG